MRTNFIALDDHIRQFKTAATKIEEGDSVAQVFLTLRVSYDPLVHETLEKMAKQWLLAREKKGRPPG